MIEQSASEPEAAISAQKLRTDLGETAEAAMVAIKSEVEHLSRATRDVASMVGAEVVKRPLTYTLAAAGAGALVGLSFMALRGRAKNTSH